MPPSVRTVSPDWHPLGVIVEDSLTAALMDLKHVSAPLKAGQVKGGGTPSGSASGSTAPASSETTSTSSSLAGTRSYVTPDDIAAIAERAAELIDEESWEEALKFVIEEHDLTSRAYGNMDDRTLQALSTYAGVLWQLGRGSDTRELLEELVDRRTQAVASIDPKAGADEHRQVARRAVGHAASLVRVCVLETKLGCELAALAVERMFWIRLMLEPALAVTVEVARIQGPAIWPRVAEGPAVAWLLAMPGVASMRGARLAALSCRLFDM